MSGHHLCPQPRRRFSRALAAGILGIVTLASTAAITAKTRDMGNGFADHGVAAPISNHRGTVATVDGEGRNVILTWLMDHRGVYSLLMVDASSGKSEQFPIPFENVKLDSPFASILSSKNKFYTHFGDHFIEFDPVKRAFTFSKKTFPQMAMGMTEDDQGTIWSVTYPDSGVVSYNPQTSEFHDYGSVYKQNWPQYQRFMAADDSGIVYFAVGNTKSQIVALDPQTSQATALLPEGKRSHGTAYVYRDKDGKVYGEAVKGDGHWLELYKGKISPVSGHKPDPVSVITDTQALMYKNFPDGAQLLSFDLAEGKFAIQDANTSGSRSESFTYTSEGAVIMGTELAPDGTLSGGTAFPMRSFSYNPETDEIVNRPAYGQWNTIKTAGKQVFVGGYPRGFLLQWDPAKPWVNTAQENPKSNPQLLFVAAPDVYRTHALLPLSDNSQVVMGGTPDYGLTGGGLLFWDRKTSKATMLTHEQLLKNHSIYSMLELPQGKILAGTTTEAGTGGEKLAGQAELAVVDAKSHKMEWHKPVLPGVQTYLALTSGPAGLVYGVADKKTFFVFDPVKREVIGTQDLAATTGISAWQQGPRIFVHGDGKIYLLLLNGIAEIDPATHKVTRLVDTPTAVEGGGAFYDGRIYYSNGSHLYSYKVSAR